MHILLAILGALAAAGVFIWRIRMAMEAAKEISELAGEAANLPRKMRFRSKARRGGIQTIDDPREAAAVLLYGAAACAGPVAPEAMASLIPVLDRVLDRPDPRTHEQKLYRDKILRRAGLR